MRIITKVFFCFSIYFILVLISLLWTIFKNHRSISTLDSFVQIHIYTHVFLKESCITQKCFYWIFLPSSINHNYYLFLDYTGGILCRIRLCHSESWSKFVILQRPQLLLFSLSKMLFYLLQKLRWKSLTHGIISALDFHMKKWNHNRKVLEILRWNCHAT